MSRLLVCHVDDAQHRSSEEEARKPLRITLTRDAYKEEKPLLPLAARLFGPERGVDLELPPREHDGQRPAPDFSGPEHGR